MLTLDLLRNQVEWQALELINQLTALGEMTEEYSQQLAQHVLDCVKPNMSPADFFRGVLKLDDGFPELAFIVTPLASQYRDQIETPLTNYIKELIQSSRYDEAIALAQKLVKYDVKIKFVAKGGLA